MSVLGILSDSNEPQPWRIGVMAPVGRGKTWLGATASTKWPDKIPAPAPVVIEDVGWVLYDRNGLSGFRVGSNVTIKNVIDIPQLLANGVKLAELKAAKLPIPDGLEARSAKDIFDAVNKAFKAMRQLTGQGIVKTWVHDTLSTYDHQLHRYWIDAFSAEGKDPERSRFNVMGRMEESLVQYSNMCDSIPANHLFLFHEKVKAVFENPKAPNETLKAEAKKAASGMDGVAPIIPKMSYARDVDFFMANVDLSAALTERFDPATRQTKRELVLHGKKEVHTKNRWQHVSGMVELANLRTLLDKLEAQTNK